MVRTQIELAFGHLSGAVTALEVASTGDELEAASAASYQAYRYLRFANHGLELLLARRFRNPLLQLAHDTVWQARWLIISARHALDNAIHYPAERAARVAEALAQLRQALDHVERARLLL
jgi:hypothetical protein